MKHSLKISVSKVPRTLGVVTCRSVSLRERFLRFLFGSKQRVTILIPGDNVEEVTISEPTGGGERDEQDRVDSERRTACVTGR
jgi:hypothetical protein